jgi:hypothetical protein
LDNQHQKINKNTLIILLDINVINSLFSSVLAIIFISQSIWAQTSYGAPAEFIETFNFDDRIVPKVPSKSNKIRIINDTDAKNEVDDQWAMALALLSPERFHIGGFVAANYDHQWSGGPYSVENSYKENLDEIEPLHCGLTNYKPNINNIKIVNTFSSYYWLKLRTSG